LQAAFGSPLHPAIPSCRVHPAGSRSRSSNVTSATAVGITITILRSPKDFQLRINGKKQPLLAQNPYMVAASVAHPDWQAEKPGVEATAGAGNARVILGGPPHTPLPTGDPPGSAGPTIPKVPKPDPPEGIDMQPAKTAAEIAVEAALPEGKNRAPVSGFLYFIYTGRTKSINRVELLYRDTVLRLR
jgi:hypothetical protein